MKELFSQLSSLTGSLKGNRLVYQAGEIQEPAEAAPVMDFGEKGNQKLTKPEVDALTKVLEKSMADARTASRKITVPPMTVEGRVAKHIKAPRAAKPDEVADVFSNKSVVPDDAFVGINTPQQTFEASQKEAASRRGRGLDAPAGKSTIVSNRPNPPSREK